MKQRDRVSYLFVLSLLLVLTFFVGIRYGGSITQVNTRSQIAQELILTLSPSQPPSSPTPEPTMVIGYREYTQAECQVSFLLPDNISSSAARFACPTGRLTATQEATLREDGFENYRVGVRSVWLAGPTHLLNLIKRTSTRISP